MVLISKIPIINSVIQKRGQRRLRKYLRFYQKVRCLKLLYKVNEAKQAISKQPCIRNGSYSRHLFGAAVNNAEIVVRQYLLRGVIDHTINKSLTFTLGSNNSPVVYPLPQEWQKVLKQTGFVVARTRSALFFFGFICAKFFAGIAWITKFFYDSLKVILLNRKQSFGRYAFFSSLGAKNVPRPNNSGNSYDVISWYEQWKERLKQLDCLVHTVKQGEEVMVAGIPVVSTSFEIQPLHSFSKLGKYFLWSCWAFVLSFVDLLRGRWWHALMLGEAGKSAAVRLHAPQELARDYLFHNAVAVYRPLWTYEAENAGSRILFYFYSTNIEFFKRHNRYPDPFIGWETSTWPNHLVWDEYQAAFMRDTVSQKINTLITGSIWFQSGDEKLPELPQKSIAVFDVQPMRDSFYSTLAMDFDYYTPLTCRDFLLDIYEAAKEIDAVLIHKRKRDIGKLAHYKYRNLLKLIDEEKNFISVDPDLPAQVIIENSMAVISMPFTSTALIGRELGKPSIYYDPHGLIRKDDKGAHGIEIVTGPLELREWLLRIVKQKVIN